MARFSSTSRRPFGRRLRSVAVAGLIVGATGAFFPGGHAAHAASPHTPTSGNDTCFVAVTSLNKDNPFPKSATGSVTEQITFTGFGTITVQINADGSVTGANDHALTGSCPTSGQYNADPSTFTGTITYQDQSGNTRNCVLTDQASVSNPGLGDDPSANHFTFTTPNAAGTGMSELKGQVGCAANKPPTPFDALIVFDGLSAQQGAATPELGSGELLATGLVPALGIVLYRRRRQRRASK